MPGNVLPHIVLHHVGVREPWPTVHGDDWERCSSLSQSFVSEIDILSMDRALGMGDGLRRQRSREKKEDGDKQQLHQWTS
jgi:hypothetical protein